MCRKSAKTTEWFFKIINGIAPTLTTSRRADVFEGNFQLAPAAKHNTILWLVTPYNLALWKARKRSEGRSIHFHAKAEMRQEAAGLKNTKDFRKNYTDFEL